MGVSIEQWRCRIGTFEQPVKCKVSLPTLRLKYVSLSIRVMLFFMLLSQGIEANPGPPPTSSVTYERGGRGGGRGRGAGAGAGRGSGRGARGGGDELYRSQSQGPGRVTRSSSQKQNRQPSINAWLNNAPLEARSDSRNSRRNNINLGVPGPNARIHTNTNAWLGNPLSSAMSDTRDNRISGSGHDRGTSDSNTNNQDTSNVFDTGSEHSDNERDDENGQSDTAASSMSRENTGPVMGSAIGADPYGMTSILMDIRRDVRHMNKKFDRLEKSVDAIKKDNKKLKAQNKELKERVDDLARTLDKLDRKSAEIESKNERLEAHSRRENLKFHGIPETDKETWEESESKVRDYIYEELEIDQRQIRIERAHRLGSKTTPKPIIVKFSFFKDKDEILKTYRQKQKEKRENQSSQSNENDTRDRGDQNNITAKPNSYMKDVRVTEDFVERVTRDRTALYPFMKDCWKEGKQAFLRYDQLVVDGVPHVYDDETKMPVAVGK